MNRRLVLLLGAAGILAILLVMRQFVWVADDGIVRPAAPPQVVAIRQESGQFLPDFPAFDAIADRPLFRADRRPPPVPESPLIETPPTTQQGGSEPGFIVVGIGTNENGGVATIRTNTETRRAYVGDRIDGWRIEAVNRASIEVSNGETSYRLFIGEDTE
ncbi:hypothetical protein [Hyphobacterium sp.]|uniref:hypothetical protein n=1 Tax=Hyphobacterium sp. TaxID=2004662 RepID=UPI003B529A7B